LGNPKFGPLVFLVGPVLKIPPLGGYPGGKPRKPQEGLNLYPGGAPLGGCLRLLTRGQKGGICTKFWHPHLGTVGIPKAPFFGPKTRGPGVKIFGRPFLGFFLPRKRGKPPVERRGLGNPRGCYNPPRGLNNFGGDTSYNCCAPVKHLSPPNRGERLPHPGRCAPPVAHPSMSWY